jgi:ubiquinone/menaquinone biosynthesis C-methylase UbiE
MLYISGTEISEGTADKTPYEDASFDVVTIAQAFHWFANHNSLKELNRIIKPGGSQFTALHAIMGSDVPFAGKLVLIWNTYDEEQPWLAELSRYVWGFKDDAPQYRDMSWPPAFEGQSYFAPLQKTSYDNTYPAVSRETILERVFSISFIGKQTPETAKVITEKIHAILDKHEISNPGSTDSPFPFRTDLYIAPRL